jgi:hypothetical protein
MWYWIRQVVKALKSLKSVLWGMFSRTCAVLSEYSKHFEEVGWKADQVEFAFF